ncbi:MAG TPA: hypothetical protein VNP92_30945 [Actinophytocola sp.]|nr:hypothetical protein [Actinophytocola sp.]
MTSTTDYRTHTATANTDWYPRSSAQVPKAIAPHPAGGRYLVEPRPEKSVGLAVLLTALFGPVGLCYLSAIAGLVVTTLSAVLLLVADMGLLPLALIWPASVAAAVWRAGHISISG